MLTDCKQMNWTSFPSMLAALALIVVSTGQLAAQSSPPDSSLVRSPEVTGGGPPSRSIYLSSVQFNIPFQIAQTGTQPSSVLLFVSTDQGATWQLHGRVNPSARQFEFRAAAEGDYLFAVKTVDASGNAFTSPGPPMKISIDTTEPRVALHADINSKGNLVVDLQASDQNLNPDSAIIRMKSDRDSDWSEISLGTLRSSGDLYEVSTEIELTPCREVFLVASVSDFARNQGQASKQLKMPRTAVSNNDLQLASTRGPAGIPGAIPWNAESESQFQNYPATEWPATEWPGACWPRPLPSKRSGDYPK
jgi:hypothetical protein